MPSPLLDAEEQVLSTLRADGSRRWLHPRLAKGRFWKNRRVVAYALIAFFSILPWIHINGQPLILIDILHRKLSLFGATFLPTDTVLLALAGLSGFFGIFFTTAVFGRVWCGWGCPQTVYLEFVFRPIERLCYGRKGRGGKPKNVAPWRQLLKLFLFLVVCAHLTNTFLAYFVGTGNLTRWIWTSGPFEHPIAFGVFIFIVGLMMFDFAFWREQMCIIGCPYGRFQSVMLDDNSLIIGYDEKRGEPRGKPRKPKRKKSIAPSGAASTPDVALPVVGDCVDCQQCVEVCPTGIDIRQGLQMECIGCAQCIDACDAIMDRFDRPRGLIRYETPAKLAGRPTQRLRPRVIIYPVIITVLVTLLTILLFNRPNSDVTLLRALGAPFLITDTGDIKNSLNIKLVNRTDAPLSYSIKVKNQPRLSVKTLNTQVTVAPGATLSETTWIFTPPQAFATGYFDVTVLVTDNTGEVTEKHVRLLGPTAQAGAQ
ncbi:MAG: cytochrome c oxidase accessory protein CcoG [Algisphaera sp.]